MRVAICDDEEIIRKDIQSRILQIIPDAEIKLYTSGEELLADNPADIILLDIQMKGISGMDTARRLRADSVESVIIFITAVEEYVFEAFDVGAFHYLVKPFSDEKFRIVFLKALDEIKSRKEKTHNERFIIVREGGLRRRIQISDIVFAEVMNRTITIHLVDDDISYRGSIGDLAKQLGSGFYQTHRSFLVNMKYVKSYSIHGIETTRGTADVARSNVKDFAKAFMKYMRSNLDD